MKFAGNAIKRFLIYLIRCYRLYTSYRAPCCRYTPTCSGYAIQAITTHGVLKGGLLAVWRILRCNPFSKGGYDPVPQKGSWRADKSPAIVQCGYGKTTYERDT